MKETNKKNIDFVLRYYKAGKIDTRKAIKRFHAETGTSQRVKSWQMIAAAASLLLLIAAGSYIFWNEDKTKLVAGNVAKTFILPDSTHVILSPHSSLSYRGDRCRDVEMTGKIFFKVKHDPQHRFDIHGEMSHVTVLGTVFQVSERDNVAGVYVVSGRVLFAQRLSDEGVILTKGMTGVLHRGDKMPVVKYDSEGINKTTWATKVFHFDNAPLDDVLQDLSSYYGVRLSCKAEGKRLSGDFDANDIDETVSIIEQVLNVKIKKQ